jgi:16S rRNA (cytidine1402-2'-O)-methyltransferase
LRGLAEESRTLVFYEAPHRIAATLADIAQCLGADRPAAVARELTKKFETVYRGTIGELAGMATVDERIARGELVVVVGGSPTTVTGDTEALRVLDILLAELPASQAARLTARITGRNRRELYEMALGRGGPSSDRAE